MKIQLLTLVVLASLVSSCAGLNQEKRETPEEKRAQVYYGQGTSDLVAQNYMQALINLTKARDLDPNNSNIRNNLGMAYFFRNQPELAVKELKKAVDLDQKNSDALLNLGSVYLNQKNYKFAKEAFIKVEKDLTFINQHRNYYNLALISLEEGDRQSALEYLSKSVKENSTYCTSYFKMGELYLEEYRFNQALEAFKQSGDGTCVAEPAPHYQQAIALLNLNRIPEAKQKFLEVKEKFASTRYGSLAAVQLAKIEEKRENTTQKSNLTEKYDSLPKTINTPNF